MMTQEKLIQAMRLRLPDAKDASDEMLLAHLTDAKALLLAMTWRQTLPEALESAQVRLAIILFNRMGMEGESAHDEGSLRRNVESLPEFLRRQLNPYRLGRAVEA